jgi:hypothetical protein
MLKTSQAALVLALSTLLSLSSVSCKEKDKTVTASGAPAAVAAQNVGAAGKTDRAHKKSLPDEKVKEVPSDWIELSDDVRGFSFSVPADGVGAYFATLPKPYDDVLTMVIAYKDARKTLDDLEKDAKGLITKVFEETNVQQVGKKDPTADFRVVEYTSEDAKTKEKSHWKALLATDVTDNYVMVVGTPEAQFKKNEATIDEVWGSFDMWSGGNAK